MTRITLLLVLVACGDDADPIHLIDAEPLPADACVPVTDAEPANDCCALDDDPMASTECVRAQLAAGTCATVSCFHGCETTRIHACRL